MRLPNSDAGIDPDKVKGKFKVAKTNLKIANKVAKSFVKGKYKTQTAIIENEGKFNLNTNRPDISGKEELRPAIDLFRKGNKQVSVPEEGRIDNVVAQATENKPKVSSEKKVTAIRKHTGETTSVKEITTKKKVNVPAQKSMITSGRGVTTSHANKPKPVSPSNTVFPKKEASIVKKKRYLAPVHRKINQRSKVRTKNPQEAKQKIQPITKKITTSVTPSLKKIKATGKPSTKTVTTTAKKASLELQKVFHKSNGTPNIENKFKKIKSVGKGIKFTRGLGAFSFLSSVLGVARGKKEAKANLGREPSVLETLEYTFLPKKVRESNPSYMYRKINRNMGIQEVQ